MNNILITAIGPILWGTTYIITTELLPENRPLLTAALRALPIGLILLLIFRQFPKGIWWFRSAVLGALTIGFFFALLFFSAYRLPGGIAATIGSLQPLLVAALAVPVLGEAFSRRKLIAGTVGVLGVGLLVIGPSARLDAQGIIAGLIATVFMAAGTILTKKWGRPAPLLVFTAWQLTVGGLILMPIALIVEGMPPVMTAENIGGYIYLGLVNTGIAYALWFRGLGKLSASSAAVLGLLSPLTAVMIDWIFLGKPLSLIQTVGMALIIFSIIAAQNIAIHIGHSRSKPALATGIQQ